MLGILLRLALSQRFIFALIRHALTAWGASVVAQGVSHPAAVVPLVAGAVALAGGLGWSAANKKLNPGLTAPRFHTDHSVNG